jgi:hypothetical protein
MAVALETGFVKPTSGQPLKIDVAGFKYDIGGRRSVYDGDVAQSVTDDDTSYVYVDQDGDLVINTTGFPTVTHIPLARVVAANGEVVAIHEERVLLASSASAIGICSITFPVDGDVRGGDTSASSNNNWACIRYDDSGTDGEGRNRLVRRCPKNYVDGDLVMRVVYTTSGTIGSNKDSFWRLSYKFASLGEALGTMASVTTTKEHDGEAGDTLHYLDLTIPEANVDATKDFMAFYVAREHDDAADTLDSDIYVHNLELRYNGRLLAGQAGQ